MLPRVESCSSGGRRTLSSVVAMAVPGGLVWPRLITGTPGGSLGDEAPPWPNSSTFRGPTGEAGLGGEAGAGLGPHTISAFSVMVGPTSAWAWGGHMDPKGVLTCGREGSQWGGGSDATHSLSPTEPSNGRDSGEVTVQWAKAGRGVGPETATIWEEGLIQGQEVPNEILCSNEPSSAVSELFVTREELSCPAPAQILFFQNPLTWSL